MVKVRLTANLALYRYHPSYMGVIVILFHSKALTYLMDAYHGTPQMIFGSIPLHTLALSICQHDQDIIEQSPSQSR